MPHLTLHHADLPEPTFLCLSALSGSIEKNSNWNCGCHFGLEVEPVCHDFPHESDTWGESSYFDDPSLKRWLQRASQVLC